MTTPKCTGPSIVKTPSNIDEKSHLRLSSEHSSVEANAQLRSLQIGARGSLDLGYGLDWKQELDLKEVFTANFASPKGNMGSPTLYMWLALLVSLKSLKT